MTARPFAAEQVLAGARDCLGVGLAVCAYGAVLGVLAEAKGLSLGELLLMNSLVFAGSAQFVTVEAWASPVPVFTVILATLVINLRYPLLTAAVRDVFAGSRFVTKALCIHVCADENWAMTIARQRSQGATPGYLVGGGVCLALYWHVGTASGYFLGALVPDPVAFGLDFAFAATFLGLAWKLWQGRSDVLPWLVSAGSALAADQVLEGKWYILVGAVAGFVTAFVQSGDEEKGRDDVAGSEEKVTP
ncbi:MAG: AzlC family ABC transporter permease [Magnetovibrionaceae bacterium]